MRELTPEAARRIERLPQDLRHEYPHVPLAQLEHDVEERVRRLIATARFDDFVPLLVRRSVREHLREAARVR